MLVTAIVAFAIAVVVDNEVIKAIGVLGALAGSVGLATMTYQHFMRKHGEPPAQEHNPPTEEAGAATPDLGMTPTAQVSQVAGWFNRITITQNSPVTQPNSNRASSARWVPLVIALACLAVLILALVKFSGGPESNARSGHPPVDLTPPNVNSAAPIDNWTPTPQDITDIIGLPCVQLCQQAQMQVSTAIDIDPPAGDNLPDLVALPGNQLKPINGAGIKPTSEGPIDAGRCIPETGFDSTGPIAAGPPMCLRTTAGRRVMLVSRQNNGSDYMTLVYAVLPR
ncbi:hypothetical protein F3087_06020 [Nocardia colli]|uniref:Uncharacterized protein n=1 Tax=Nocardia colli TaxID=2545717 RepID=A0A5N0EMV8_9NOCA|nr:hypothetical protein [Nocardia colli]KAA8890787.1 hypothetical protein F3087_06020 [Nocardia colli]